MNYRLIKPQIQFDENDDIQSKIFKTRGIENYEEYINVSDKDILNPLLLDNVREGADMLFSHISNKDKILFIVDCDVDGFTSAAELINYLNKLIPGYAQNYISWFVHEEKVHGLQDTMEYINNHPDFKLIVCPDSSSNDYEFHKQLKDKGVDVLVLDHHEASKVSEYACVINNQLCDYPNKTLSGAGVVWKFCCFMDSVLETTYAEDIVDLAAMGMIADMMDIRNYETKAIINKGIKNLQNPFFKEAFKKQKSNMERKGGISPFNISYYITPLLNATIRVGTIENKQLLFESMLDYHGYAQIPSTKRGCKGQLETKVDQAYRNCNSLKKTQGDLRDSYLSIIEKQIEEESLLDNKILVIQINPKTIVNRNITGLIANQIVSKYQHPVLLLTKSDNNWMGSGRGFEVPGLEDFKAFVSDSGYSCLAEGHANAFGVGIPEDKVADFISYSNEALSSFKFVPSEKVDFIWTGQDFSGADVIKIAEVAEYIGQNIPGVKIAIERIELTPENTTLLTGGRTPALKIKLDNGVELIKFNFDEELYHEQLEPSDYCHHFIDIIGTCGINEWCGRITPQIMIEDFEFAGSQLSF